MKYDISSFEIFLNELNPISFTKFDDSALQSEDRFTHQLDTYEDSHAVRLYIDNNEIGSNFSSIEDYISSLNFEKLGFRAMDKINIEITEIIGKDSVESYNIKVHKEAVGEFPTLESEKTKFYEGERNKICREIMRHLKKKTLKFKTEDQLAVFINQQYQFALHIQGELYRRWRLTYELSSIFDEVGNKKPNETNGVILSFLISDLWSIVRFIETNYKQYLKGSPTDPHTFKENLFKKKEPKKIQHKSSFKRIIDFDTIELKPNIWGIGINLNEVIRRIKKRND